jgi:hypothetical protein
MAHLQTEVFHPAVKHDSAWTAMGTLIRMIFREGNPRKKLRLGQSRRSTIARERGLMLWHERDDLVIAAAFRVVPAGDTKIGTQPTAFVPLKFAPQA